MTRSKLRMGPINAATPTPLLPDGSFDRASARRLAAHWKDIALDGVFVLGSMGEGLLLSDTDRNNLVAAAVEDVGDDLTLFVGVADSSRSRMAERALRYGALGAHCAVICFPPGASPRQAVADVLAVAEASRIPCAFYDAPFNTGAALVLEDFLQILSHPNIVAFKDSSGNALLAQALTSPQHQPSGIALLAGVEYQTTYSALLGYHGVLHGGASLTGARVRQVWQAATSGNIASAMQMDRENSLLLATIYNRFSRPLQNTMGQKHALKLLGILDHDFTIEQTLDDASRRRIAHAVSAAPWLRDCTKNPAPLTPSPSGGGQG